MKLSRIPTVEKTAKRSFSFRQSTWDSLDEYLEEYQKHHGTKVDMKDLVERMVLDFMEADKDFQKKLTARLQAPKGGKPAAGQEAGAAPDAPDAPDASDASDAAARGAGQGEAAGESHANPDSVAGEQADSPRYS